MSLSPTALGAALNGLLEPARFADPSSNGLQVDAGAPVAKVATAVSVSLEAIAAAAAGGAQALVVHHGLFWGRADAPGAAVLGGRVRALLAAKVSLLAYHLPLDAHPTLGNNLPALAAWGVAEPAPFGHWEGQALGGAGDLPAAEAVSAFRARLANYYGQPPLHLPGGPHEVRRVALVTGGGADFLSEAAAAGCDALVTGEAEERSAHWAREAGIHLFACGHHATERLGVRLLAAWLQSELGLGAEYLEVPNPV